MTYKVVVTSLAESDLEYYADFIAQDSPDRAQQWLREAWKIIFSLEKMPYRFAIIPESEELGERVRGVIHHSHRIIYRIDELSQKVQIIRVWHAYREEITPSDL